MLILDLIDAHLQTERAKTMKAAKIIVYHSLDSEHWTPILPADVPEWVKEPNTMGRLVKGDMAQTNGGGGWYRAEIAEDGPVLEIPGSPGLKHTDAALDKVKQ